jgi:peptidoglycan/LPS O-acetylase OafA/YrhL
MKLLHPLYKQSSISNYRKDIDGLRALAVLLVVGFHAFPNSIGGGFIGVDVFFVISGYLISTIIFSGLERSAFSFIDFYHRRIRRIFPALILVLIASFSFGWFALTPNEFKQFGKHMAGGAGFLSNLLQWQESGYFDSAAETKPLLHLWSLGIEEQFYLVWPLLLWLVWKKRFNLLTVTILIAIASFSFNLLEAAKDPIATFYSPLTRFWELLVGAILAYLTLYPILALQAFSRRCEIVLNRIIYRNPLNFLGTLTNSVLSLVGFCFILVGVTYIKKATPYPGYWALLPTLGAACMICAGPPAWFNRVLLANRFAVWIGLISFPLYLWHWPILAFARIMVSGIPSVGIRIMAVLLSIGLASLTYLFVEKPLRTSAGKVKLKQSSLLIFMIVIGLIGAVTYFGDGLAFRLPKTIQEIDLNLQKYEQSVRSDWRDGKCFLHQNGEEFKSECIDVEPIDSPLIYVWGDSHAAALSVGLRDMQKNYRFRVAQFTQSSCAPEIYNPGCPINNYSGNIKRISKLAPAVVILHANWRNIRHLHLLSNTIRDLKKLGVEKIIVVGQVPIFSTELSEIILKEFRKNNFKVSTRIVNEIDQNAWKIDDQIKAVALDEHADYFSVKEIMCNTEGCLAVINQFELTSFRGNHLSPPAAKIIANSLLAKLFKSSSSFSKEK